MKAHVMDWKKIFSTCITNKRLVISEELLKNHKERTNKAITNGQRNEQALSRKRTHENTVRFSFIRYLGNTNYNARYSFRLAK